MTLEEAVEERERRWRECQRLMTIAWLEALKLQIQESAAYYKWQ